MTMYVLWRLPGIIYEAFSYIFDPSFVVFSMGLIEILAKFRIP